MNILKNLKAKTETTTIKERKCPVAKKKAMGDEKQLFAHLGQMCRNHGLLYGDGIIMLNPEDQFGFKGAMKGKSDLNSPGQRREEEGHHGDSERQLAPFNSKTRKIHRGFPTQQLSFHLPLPPSPAGPPPPSLLALRTELRTCCLLRLPGSHAIPAASPMHFSGHLLVPVTGSPLLTTPYLYTSVLCNL